METRFEVLANDKNFITIQDNFSKADYFITEDTIEDFLNKQNDKIAKLKKEIKALKEDKQTLFDTKAEELCERMKDKLSQLVKNGNERAIERLERVRDYFANCLCNGAIAREKDISDIIDYLNKQINTLAKE